MAHFCKSGNFAPHPHIANKRWYTPPFFYSERISDVEVFLHFFASLIAVILNVVSLAMMARMIISLIFGHEDSRIATFLVCVTEPFIMPVRFIMAKLNVLQNSPIDWSFTFAYLLIIFLRFVLPAV